MELIDIGVNLAHDSFDPDRGDVLARARDAGVTTFIVTGSSRESSHGSAALCAAHPGELYCTAGVHPHHASGYDAGASGWIRALCEDPAVVAVGECGLDFFRNFSSHEDQLHAFRAQLELAADLQMPVFLHQRDAHAPFCEVLDEYLDRIPRAVAHCFTGDGQELADYLARDLYIGITGWICDERRGAHLGEVVGEIPPDRLMLETDAPYLLPRDLKPRPRSRRNEPMYLEHVARTVAAHLGVGMEELAASTTANARRFFGIDS
jgi:TatD DNase family protein